MFPKIGVPQNGWFIMENPIKMGDLVVPLFSETPIFSKVPFGRGFLLVPRRVFTIFMGRFHKFWLKCYVSRHVQGAVVRAAGTTLSCAIVMWKFALLPHILMRLENIRAVSNSDNLRWLL